MMFISSTTCRIFLVLAAACNAVTYAQEAEVELISEDHRPTLRGNAATPVESLDDARSRMLGYAPGFSVQAGAAIVFTHPPTKIHAGDACAFGAVTGIYGIDYVFTNKNNAVSELVSSSGCDPMATSAHLRSLFYLLEEKLNLPPVAGSSLIAAETAARHTVIDAEMGGQTFYPGIYFASSLTMAANTVVTLKGNGVFQFISGSTMVANANTKVIRAENTAAEMLEGQVGYGKPAGTPESYQIEWDVTLGATLGASSEVKGSILAGAAITLGLAAKVSGCILALAGVTLGAECDINEDMVTSPTHY
jgi:hypothetical protein